MKSKNKYGYNSLPQSGDSVERAARPMRQPQVAPFPMAQAPAPAYQFMNTGTLPVVPNGMPLGLPVYSTVDEYGRSYSPILSYAPQPNSAPVPVATPSTIVQLTPIVSPVSFVPYSTQNQALYQFDEDNQ